MSNKRFFTIFVICLVLLVMLMFFQRERLKAKLKASYELGILEGERRATRAIELVDHKD